MNRQLQADVDRAKAHYLEVLGVLPEPIRAMAEYAPEALVAYQQFKDYLYKPPQEAALDLKTKELIYVVLDTATGNLAGANNHLRAAVDQGLTVPQLAEAMIQVMNVCGITTFGQTGYKVLDECKRLTTQAAGAKKTPARKKAAVAARSAR
ncbi:MAG TPA: carboxymuconolactone decarboxylase family protein [Ramlibacter sp.]|nr:carboxymuconolactone decarboxylase family protein [Ramlibacter sp.]